MEDNSHCSKNERIQSGMEVEETQETGKAKRLAPNEKQEQGLAGAIGRLGEMMVRHQFFHSRDMQDAPA